MALLSILSAPIKRRDITVVSIIDAPFASIAAQFYNTDERRCEHGILCTHPWTNSLNETTWTKTCCVGMSIELLKHVAQRLNFNPHMYIVQDGFYGSRDAVSGEWNGMMRQLISKQAELAVGALTPTHHTQSHVDFTQPYMEASVGILEATDSRVIDFINMEFLKPLGTDLRYWIVATFGLGTLLVYILENQRLALLRIIDPHTYPRYSWREGFSYFSGLTFQRDLGGRNPQRFGARVTAVAFAFGMVIIMTTYTAVLTASKVSKGSTFPMFGFLRKVREFSVPIE